MSERARRQWVAPYADAIGIERASRLLERYGTVAASVIDAIADAGEGDTALGALPDYSTAELAHLARTEHVVHLADLLLRRTAIAFTGAATDEVIAEVAAVIAPALGWDDARVAAEIASARAEVDAAVPGSAPDRPASAQPASASAIA